MSVCIIVLDGLWVARKQEEEEVDSLPLSYFTF